MNLVSADVVTPSPSPGEVVPPATQIDSSVSILAIVIAGVLVLTVIGIKVALSYRKRRAAR